MSDGQLEAAWLPDAIRAGFLFLLSVLSLVASGGNALVLAVAVRDSKMRTANNCFIFNLAVCDAVVGFFSIPIMIITMSFQRWVFGDVLCNVGAFLDNLVMMQSTWTLATLSAFRAFSVTNPLRFKQRSIRKNVIILLGILWIVASVIVAAPMYGWNKYQFSTITFNCGSDVGAGIHKYFFLVFIVLVLFVPSFVVVTSYILILYTALSKFSVDPASERRCGGSKKSRSSPVQVSTRKNTTSNDVNVSPKLGKIGRLKKNRMKNINSRSAKSSIRVLIIVGVFLVCVGPLLGISFVMWLGIDPHLSPIALITVYIISLSHSAINPCIYGLFDIRFRQAYKEMFRRPSKSCNGTVSFKNSMVSRNFALSSLVDVTRGTATTTSMVGDTYHNVATVSPASTRPESPN